MRMLYPGENFVKRHEMGEERVEKSRCAVAFSTFDEYACGTVRERERAQKDKAGWLRGHAALERKRKGHLSWV